MSGKIYIETIVVYWLCFQLLSLLILTMHKDFRQRLTAAIEMFSWWQLKIVIGFFITCG